MKNSSCCPHAIEHMTAAAQPVLGPATPELKAWLDKQAHTLKHAADGARQVLMALTKLPVQRPAHPITAEARDRTVAYFTKRLAQVQYSAFQATGYPIGSGSTESANKIVVETRLKGSGMHWARAHVESSGGAAHGGVRQPLARGLAAYSRATSEPRLSSAVAPAARASIGYRHQSTSHHRPPLSQLLSRAKRLFHQCVVANPSSMVDQRLSSHGSALATAARLTVTVTFASPVDHPRKTSPLTHQPAGDCRIARCGLK
jgi:hypothetical protein